MSTEIGQKIIDAVRSVAARNPSFVYSNPSMSMDAAGDYSCVYVKDGHPSCLIGHALWDLGLIDAQLERHRYNTIGVDDLLAWLDDVELDNDEVNWLHLAQMGQDAEKPWAEAVKWADLFEEEMLLDW